MLDFDALSGSASSVDKPEHDLQGGARAVLASKSRTDSPFREFPDPAPDEGL
jgi:hypothetical protein